MCFSFHFGFINLNHLISKFTQAAESVGGGGGGEKVSPKPSMMAEALNILTGTILGQHPTITTNNYFCVQEVGTLITIISTLLSHLCIKAVNIIVYKSPQSFDRTETVGIILCNNYHDCLLSHTLIKMIND